MLRRWMSLMTVPIVGWPVAAAGEPVVGRPAVHYYGAHGQGVRLYWRVEPPEVVLGNTFTATLVIERVANPQAVQMPDLRQIEAFASRFEVVESQADRAATTPGEVRFIYRLRLRRQEVEDVPGLPFYYFNPAAPEGKQYVLTAAAAVPLRVLPPATPPQAVEPLDILAQWLAMLEASRTPAATGQPGWLAWLLAAAAGPLLAIGCRQLVRRLWPDAVRLGRWQRSRLARQAWRELRAAAHSPQPLAAAVAALHRYLQARLALPPGAVTPLEVAARLADAGLPPKLAARVVELLRQGDAARFQPNSSMTTEHAEGGRYSRLVVEVLVELEERLPCG